MYKLIWCFTSNVGQNSIHHIINNNTLIHIRFMLYCHLMLYCLSAFGVVISHFLLLSHLAKIDVDIKPNVVKVYNRKVIQSLIQSQIIPSFTSTLVIAKWIRSIVIFELYSIIIYMYSGIGNNFVAFVCFVILITHVKLLNTANT